MEKDWKAEAQRLEKVCASHWALLNQKQDTIEGQNKRLLNLEAMCERLAGALKWLADEFRYEGSCDSCGSSVVGVVNTGHYGEEPTEEGQPYYREEIPWDIAQKALADYRAMMGKGEA